VIAKPQAEAASRVGLHAQSMACASPDANRRIAFGRALPALERRARRAPPRAERSQPGQMGDFPVASSLWREEIQLRISAMARPPGLSSGRDIAPRALGFSLEMSYAEDDRLFDRGGF
jgi:hypothetical protein